MTIQLYIDGIAVKEIILPEESFDYMKNWTLEERCEHKEKIVRKHLHLLKARYEQMFISLGHHVQYVIAATSKADPSEVSEEEFESLMQTLIYAKAKRRNTVDQVEVDQVDGDL